MVRMDKLTHILSWVFVGIEDNVGISIVELAIVILGPVRDLQEKTQVHGKVQLTRCFWGGRGGVWVVEQIFLQGLFYRARVSRPVMLSLYQCIVVYLELDYTPDLYSNLASSALPSWLSLCRLFLYLSCMAKLSIKFDGSLGAIASRKSYVRTFLSVSEPNSARLLSFQSYFFAFLSPAIFLNLLFSIDRVTSQQGDVIDHE